MKHRAYIIGIAGGSASGKSTFSSMLHDRFSEIGKNVKVISMDSYFLSEEELPRAEAHYDKTKIYLDYNHPDSFYMNSLNNDIDFLIDTNIYDVIIVEGLLVLYNNDLYQKLDLRVFVDCPADVRIVRRIRRNTKWGLSVDEITDVYVDLVRYRHEEYVEPTKQIADIIINGLEPFDNACENIIEIAKNKVK